jgi:predicted glycosyltransferase involved in capsule biosynthesis
MSLIVSALESYEVVRRHLLHFNRVMPADCELILLDDGSEPSLEETCASVNVSFDFTLKLTGDRRPWTQPKARNMGAALAKTDRLLFFDIDHIVTESVIAACLAYEGDKLHWVRRPGILDEEGRIVTDPGVLIEHGMTDEVPSVHANSFMIRKAIFDHLGGYDERFCGRYGGDDIDFNERYRQLCLGGMVRAEDVTGEGYVFPDPSKDVKGMFHSLRAGEAASRI